MEHEERIPPIPVRDGIRTLKVYNKYIFRRTRFQYRNYTIEVPEIRLIGKWLADCGFEPGQYIEVIPEAGKLTITPAWFERPDTNKEEPDSKEL